MTAANPLTPPSAVAFILHVPWDEANRRLKWTLDLVDIDDNPITLQMRPDAGPEPVHAESEFVVGRPPQIKPGSEIDVPFAFNVGPMPLASDSTFVWVLRVGEQSWRETFTTLPRQ